MPRQLEDFEMTNDYFDFPRRFGIEHELSVQNAHYRMLIDAFPPTLKRLKLNMLQSRYERAFEYLVEHCPPQLQELDISEWPLKHWALWFLAQHTLPRSLKQVKIFEDISADFLGTLARRLPANLTVTRDGQSLRRWTGRNDPSGPKWEFPSDAANDQDDYFCGQYHGLEYWEIFNVDDDDGFESDEFSDDEDEFDSDATDSDEFESDDDSSDED
ncbi:hypothetical protein H9P43_006124 [Blastocladiella emersonii ATCC 22665]|nr:hypothetical protein H9P43_006124 [Blastocladiella emersonii ATCC 22665]